MRSVFESTAPQRAAHNTSLESKRGINVRAFVPVILSRIGLILCVYPTALACL